MSLFQFIGFENPEMSAIAVRLTYASGVPSITTGKGYTITDDGTGLFTIKTKFAWKACWPCLIRKCTLAVGGSVEEVSNSPSARTIQLRILGDADAAEDPADADGVVGVIFFQRVGLAAV